ncbi:MAG TPA: FkbM family methyltransferase [Candidatus Sulfotelmatobacter sp.]|jgi:FkbM family methyltransferase|nr:FkbM family methyltransferase [Candidatus Sulfotelmatobacter sp.]
MTKPPVSRGPKAKTAKSAPSKVAKSKSPEKSPGPTAAAVVQPIPAVSEIKTPRERSQDLVRKGIALMGANKIAEAVAVYDEAIAIDSGHPDAWGNRGVALRRLGRPEQALASYWRAMETVQDKAVLWTNIANCLLDMTRREEALAALHNAMSLKPGVPEHWRVLSSLLLQKNHQEAGEAALRRAIALGREDAPTLVRLGSMMNQLGEYELSLEIVREALEKAPLLADAHSSLGQTLISMGRLDEAEPALRRALELDSEHLDARLGLARKLLLEGALQTGWVEYEWRRRKPESKISKLPGKEWNGEPLAGKTLLIHAEQGFGDLIQFARYVPILAKQGARVILAVPQVLRRLLATVEGVADVVTALKDGSGYDYHIPLLSIPRIIGISLDKIPNAVPYLKAPNGPVLPAPLGTRMKVGIVWAGSPKHANDRNRSITLENLMPLAGVHGVTLYSLQTGPHSGDIAKESHGSLVRDLSSHLRDFMDTANIVRQLDLVICVDTSVAHLAGALGKPVWVLTPYAPDWRWILGRDDNPWYPSMRLLRQTAPNRWDDVVTRAANALITLVERYPDPTTQGEVMVNSLFAAADGGPRFRMWAPRTMLNDAGVRFLVRAERWDGGYEYSTRSFLDAHLQPGDLFIDVGAHWGIMSLQAATRWPGQIKALACEPAPLNQENLRQWIDRNGLADQIEVIPAAISDRPGQGGLRPESTMGHSLVRQEGGQVAVTTIDEILARRPELAGRRVIVKIDVEGSEIEVVDGMTSLLDSGRVAAVIWEKGHDYDGEEGRPRIDAIRGRFTAHGFTAWRFGLEEDAGPLRPFAFDDWRGNVIELAPGLAPMPSYGLPRLPQMPQPPDPMLEANRKASELIRNASDLQSKNRIDAALNEYDKAAMQDMRHADLYNNVGVALRGMGRLAAAEACYRRSIAINSRSAGSISNLGNVLREMGRHQESAQYHNRAIQAQPDNPRVFYNAGLVARDAGEPTQSRLFFEKVLAMDPGNHECQWDWALSLLQEGDYKRGLPAYEARWKLERSQAKLTSLPEWKGEPLNGKTLFLHDEQGFGDVLMFARFIPEARRRGAGKIILQCQPELMRLMALTPGIDQVIRRGQEPPAECDVFAPLLSLAGIFGYDLESLPRQVPYLAAPSPMTQLPDNGRLKMGLVWAGKPTPRDRSYPLRQALPALGDPRWDVYSLQMGPRAKELKELGADAFITDLAPNLVDFAETAAILSKLDLLVTCDTSIAHLAGALGVPTFMLLLYTSDWRWFDKGSDSPWYPRLRIFRQPTPNDWDTPMRELSSALTAWADDKTDLKASPIRLP